ncbi:MAG: DNA-3-methyladenine glycosylase [Patescibacteria group bacterium]
MQKEVVAKALYQLKKDSHLKGLIARFPEPDFDGGQKGLTAFQALLRAIVFQQLSGKAARTILDRFLEQFPKGRFPSPEEVKKLPESAFRSAGISSQKTSYLKDLAEKFLDGTVVPKHFSKMTDEEIHEHVVAVKGVGPWTADMFLMFTLGRPDVLPTGDLGIQKAMQKLFKLKTLPTPEKMRSLAEEWRPYRTVACWYLWRLSDEGNTNRP